MELESTKKSHSQASERKPRKSQGSEEEDVTSLRMLHKDACSSHITPLEVQVLSTMDLIVQHIPGQGVDL